jgi:hypothetical protein
VLPASTAVPPPRGRRPEPAGRVGEGVVCRTWPSGEQLLHHKSEGPAIVNEVVLNLTDYVIGVADEEDPPAD